MTYECELTEADYRAFRWHMRYRHFKLHWYYAGLVCLVLALNWFGGDRHETVVQKLFTLLGGLIVFGGFAGLYLGISTLFRRLTGRRFIGPLGRHVFVVSSEGICETNEHGTAEIRRAGIRAVDETSDHFFVITRGGVGYILPKRGHTDFTSLYELRGDNQ